MGMTLAVPSRLTVENRNAFRRELLAWIDDAIARGDTAITLDLAQTEDLDVSGIALLVAVQQRASLHDVHITLRGPNDRVRQMLTLSRMSTLFTIQP
jgi:anti-anti-sigma factor